MTEMGVCTIEEAIEDIRQGKMIILVDDEDRENEGDLVIAAEYATPEAINFMARFGRGLICLTLTETRCDQLGLPPMVRENRAQHGTAFTVSLEAAAGVTTGISAHDRARTVKAAVAQAAKPSDLVQPGHIFPLRAKKGGVLVRAGHTEAGCDLAALAGFEPAAVICEILKEDGTMARLSDLGEFAREHNLKIGTIAELIQYRSHTETLVTRVASKPVRTAQGEFLLHAYADQIANDVHLALVSGNIESESETLVRVHEQISVLDFLDPDSGRHTFSFDRACRMISLSERGVVVLLRRPESGQDIVDGINANTAQRVAKKWDSRLYGIGAQILRDLGVGKMRLLASPQRFPSMIGFDLEVTGYVENYADIEKL